MRSLVCQTYLKTFLKNIRVCILRKQLTLIIFRERIQEIVQIQHLNVLYSLTSHIRNKIPGMYLRFCCQNTRDICSSHVGEFL